jgi:hypothetical protein
MRCRLRDLVGSQLFATVIAHPSASTDVNDRTLLSISVYNICVTNPSRACKHLVNKVMTRRAKSTARILRQEGTDARFRYHFAYLLIGIYLGKTDSLAIPITQTDTGEHVRTSVWLAPRCPTPTMLPPPPPTWCGRPAASRFARHAGIEYNLAQRMLRAIASRAPCVAGRCIPSKGVSHG